ncbi:MAG: RNA methyltransferase [Vulcanococcus sp.]
MTLPEQLLLSDLLRRRVRCQAGIDHGPGVLAWMHPPVHRLLGWISKPSAFGERRQAWRLDQLRGLAELEALVQGEGAETDLPTCERLPTLIDATLLDRRGDPIGTLADAAVELSTGRIRHYLVSRSDPRLPGSSRWRLSPDRIVDQQPGQVSTGLSGLDDLPLARASVRQELLRRSRRWRDQVQEETSRLRDQFQQAGDRFEERFSERLEGWLEEPEPEPEPSWDRYGDREPQRFRTDEASGEAWDDWDEDPEDPPLRPTRSGMRPAPEQDDPWV